MTIRVAAVKKRLDKYAEVSHLPPRDKKRVYDILKHIENRQKTQNNYISALKKSKVRPKVSIPYLVANIDWLRQKGYLTVKKGKKSRKLLFLTDKAREALLVLDDYFSSPLGDTLKISLNLPGENEVEVNLHGDLENILKTAILSNKFIRDRILELSSTLLSLQEDVSLTVKIPAVKEKKIHVLLKLMWGFYWQKVTESGARPSPLGPLYINMNLTDEKRRETYTEFWRKHMKKYLRFRGEQVHEYVMADGEKSWTSKRPLFPALPRELEDVLPIYVKDKEVRKWIEKQLEKDPDWFMPHYFWVRVLDFNKSSKREDLESFDVVSPPIFYEMPLPKVTEGYAKFDSMLRYAVRKEDEKSIRVFHLMILKSDWRSRDFYESWRLVRIVYKEKIEGEPRLRETARILDEAFLMYIIANHQPQVDLQSVLDDYWTSEDVETIIKKIRGGKYELVR